MHQKKRLKKVYHRKEKSKMLYCQCVKCYHKEDGDQQFTISTRAGTKKRMELSDQQRRLG